MGHFRSALVKRAKEAAPAVRVTLTLWNIDGRPIDAESQTLTVASSACKERAFEIPTKDMLAAMNGGVANAAATDRMQDLHASIVVALIGRANS